MIRHFLIIMAISAGMPAAAGAQTDSTPGRPPGVAHGVSSEYEQADGFPYFDTHTVHVSNKEPYYKPAEITVEVGDTVHWINQPLSDVHTIIDAGGRFTSRPIAAGRDYCYHFVQGGEYDYSCRFHPWMKGVVHVRPRELSLQPLAELPAGTALLARATFLALHPEAIEDGDNVFWLPGAQLTTLEHHTAGQDHEEVLVVNEAGGRLVPLLVSGGKLMVAAYAELLVVDPASGKVLDRFQLPREVNLARGARFAEGRLWAFADDGKTLVFADTVNRIIRTRMLPDDSRIVALRAGAAGTVWALDAGRRMLLKLGADWFSEISLPSSLGNARSIAVDRENRPWIVAPDSGIAATVVSDGQIAEFSFPASSLASLLQLSGLSEPLLSTGPDLERIAVVRQQLGHRISSLQKDSNCESPAGLEIKQRAEAAVPAENRRPQ